MIYGYCRVSSKGQLDNNSLEQQEKEIKERYSEAILYKEQFTGKTTDRPVFNEVISNLKEGDTLVTTKLDRFCRSTKEGIDLIKRLQEKNINIHILNMGLIENSPMGDLITTCLLAFAQFERAMIIERTSTGKEIAKKNPDFKEGRPKKYSDKQLRKAAELKSSGLTYDDIKKKTGIGKTILWTYMKEN